MATVNLAPIGNGFQFFNSNGQPLNAGLLYTYQAGSSTLFTTYTDKNGLIANPNPIVLGTDGRTPNEIWLLDGYFYKFILKDSNNNTIGTYDNLYGSIQQIPATAPALPSGAIILWSGSIGSIPAGYYLCNGANGTPDLRDRFVVGAGNNYAVAATGGSADAIVVSHTHTASASVTDPGHNHLSYVCDNSSVPFYNATAVSGLGTGGLSEGPGEARNFTSTTDTKTTGVTVSVTNTSTGNSGTNANLPPYYALCWIMKS